MKAAQNKFKLNQQGLSLVEIVVGLLISGIVILAIGGFMAVGTNTFRKTNTETQLQKESQIATNLIDDILLKAKASSIEFYSFTYNSKSYVTLLTYSLDEDGKPCFYAVTLDKSNSRLLFHKITEENLNNLVPSRTIKEWIEEKVPAITDIQLLANYATEMDVIINSNRVETKLTFKLKDEEFTTYSTVTVRNK